MSGINELKKKAKLSIDDMYEAPMAGKPENQADVTPENQLAGNPAGVNYAAQTNLNEMANQKDKELLKMIQTPRQQKEPVFKMTFNLPESVYKAFNNLYATRLLEERKTEKSEMICEAIQLLLLIEKERIQN